MGSPNWQTMWIESQHCSKSIVNVPLPSQQTKKILEDLRTCCCSPNKAVQVEALKCWGLWIQNQNTDDWKLNTVCFTAVTPLITKKLQPLHKDVDICKMKLGLMWALLVKVQDIMQLEGPQYILEVFLQSCLTWLSSTTSEDTEEDIFLLIFQLLLSVFNKNETLTVCDKELFPPLSSHILHVKKVFHRVADKFLNLFIYWRKVKDKSVILKIWRHFLEHCEDAYEHIPIPVWHKVFKLAVGICSEKDEPVKERLAFLHSCATTLKSALSSSKFIDFGNLLTTPCEVFLKKLVELCTIDCDEFRDSEMFLHSKEICEVLSSKSVAINGYDLCISVLDVLEEFCLRSLFWGVWCGLVYCYKSLLMGTHQLTKIEMKFYRKLRGFVVNFELDRKDLHEDCVKEVERHIGLLSIGCICSYKSVETEVSKTQSEQTEPKENLPQCVLNGASNKIVPVIPRCAFGQFSLVTLEKRKNYMPRKTLSVNFDLMKDILDTLSVKSTKSLFVRRSTFAFRFVSLRTADRMEMIPRTLSLPFRVEVSGGREGSAEECVSSPKPPCTPVKKSRALSESDERGEVDEEVISTPTTRSKRRAEEERKKELEMQKRRKRRSFEVLVQEIVRKNKERKTEKNNKRRRSPDGSKGKRSKRKVDKEKHKLSANSKGKEKKSSEDSNRRLRNSTKAEDAKIQKSKEKNSLKTKGKLENYFKVITKKCGNDTRKEVKKPPTKGVKRTNESSCCKSEKEGERRGEIGWRQTSLKTMMKPKIKVEKVKQGIRTRDKTGEVAQEKPKVKKEERKDKEGNGEKVKKEERKDKEGNGEKVKKEERKDKEGNGEKVKKEERKDKGNGEKVKKEERKDKEGNGEKVKKEERKDKEGNGEKVKKEKKRKERKGVEAKMKNEERKDKKGTEEKVKKGREGRKEKRKNEDKKKAKNQERTEEKVQNEGKKDKDVFNRPLVKQSPFKEVFHDHEYAKMKPLEKMEMTAAKKQKTTGKQPGESDFKKASKPEFWVTFPAVQEKPQIGGDERLHVEALPSSVEISMSEPEESELRTTEEVNLQKMEVHETSKWARMMEPLIKKSIEADEEELEKPSIEVVEERLRFSPIRTDVCFGGTSDNFSLGENEAAPLKRGKKRVRELENQEPNKKMRLEEEEEEIFGDLPLPLEITEKENLEEKHPELISPMKKEKTGCLTPKQNGSGKAVSSGMSRALRIIGLVPESSKGRSWELSPRTEALKCLKAPNVDKNSRASKMLALLSENIVEPEEAAKAYEEDVNSSIAMATTPNTKTPTSSLKSPKAIKKRRSIRFDDAKNETVIYQTDTPPSQILEEREKRRGIRPFEISVILP